MSDPQPAPGKKQPERAEPLQPDLPGRGDTTGSSRTVDIDDSKNAGSHGDKDPGDASEAQQLQTETALKNVRDGYK